MKNLKIMLALLVIAVSVVLRLQGEPTRTDINPAMKYYQAFLVAPNMSEAELDYLATNSLWSTTLPPRFGELVGRYDAEFKLLGEAAKASVPCDWGIDMSHGPATLLPHLARCKAAMIGAR